MITPDDIALIRTGRSKGKYTEFSESEKAAHAKVHDALKALGQVVVDELGGEETYRLKLTSGFHPASGIRGGKPKDLWFGVYRRENEEELLGNPQIFMIISERGVEYGFGALTHPDDFSNQEIKKGARAIAARVLEQMPQPGSNAAKELEERLRQTGPWHFRRKQRLDPNTSEFETLEEWLRFVRSEAGERNAGGGITRYLLPDQVQDADLEKLVRETAQIFEPLMAQVRGASDPAGPEESKAMKPSEKSLAKDNETPQSYTIDQAMAELFMEREMLERALAIWRARKNLVLQGAPGVGKTYTAQRLAYLMIGQKDPSRLGVVQFHQSYSYEDFVQGYRPDGRGGFALRDGAFYRFCEKARGHPASPHVFMIDEINRGNLSKILGELMLLIEPDKRGPSWATTLTYSGPDSEPFHVPENVFVIGMMNTADRSLSIVDYALRRRFAFVTLEPMFGSSGFRRAMDERGVSPEIVSMIVERMLDLNRAIGEDRANLGPGYRIGHSFFMPPTRGFHGIDWYRRIIETEIYPLLDEYWFDDPDRASDWQARLLEAVP